MAKPIKLSSSSKISGSAVIMAVGWFFLTSVVLLHFLELQPLPDRKTDCNSLPEASLCGYASSKNSGLLSKRAQAIVAWRAASSTRDKERIHHSIKLTFSTVSSSLFTSRPQKQVISRILISWPVIGDLSCSVEEVTKLLQSIDVNKASGPDNISPRVLKECAMELALPPCLNNQTSFLSSPWPC